MSAIIEAELVSSPMLVPRESDLPPLTFKQIAFVNHYLDPDNKRNGTQAAIKAGYSNDPTVASAISVENLRKPSIQAHIQHALKIRHISPDEVIAELSDIALLPKNDLQSTSNPDSPYNANHKLKALETASKLLGMDSKPDETSTDAAKELLVDVFSALFEKYRAQADSAIKALSPASTDS